MGSTRCIEVLCDVMEYVMNEVRLIEALRKKWQDVKMSNLEYYILDA